MARDRHARDRPGPTPVDQLDAWRDWRHDTAEFPPVPREWDDETGRAGRRRPHVGTVAAGALLCAALGLSGLTVLGIGPVARLVGSGDRAPRSSTTPTSTTPTRHDPGQHDPGQHDPGQHDPGQHDPDQQGANRRRRPAGRPAGRQARPGRRPGH